MGYAQLEKLIRVRKMISIWLSGFCFCGFLWEMYEDNQIHALFALAMFGLNLYFGS